MSTQAIRSILLRFKEKCGDDMLPGERDVLDGSRAEVEAIERAAKALVEWSEKPTHKQRLDLDAARAFGVLERIAEDVPRDAVAPRKDGE